MIAYAASLPDANLGPDPTFLFGSIGALIVVAIVVAIVAWRKGWLGPANEARIKKQIAEGKAKLREKFGVDADAPLITSDELLELRALVGRQRELIAKLTQEVSELRIMDGLAKPVPIQAHPAHAELLDALIRGDITQAQYDERSKS